MAPGGVPGRYWARFYSKLLSVTKQNGAQDEQEVGAPSGSRRRPKRSSFQADCQHCLHTKRAAGRRQARVSGQKRKYSQVSVDSDDDDHEEQIDSQQNSSATSPLPVLYPLVSLPPNPNGPQSAAQIIKQQESAGGLLQLPPRPPGTECFGAPPAPNSGQPLFSNIPGKPRRRPSDVRSGARRRRRLLSIRLSQSGAQSQELLRRMATLEGQQKDLQETVQKQARLLASMKVYIDSYLTPKMAKRTAPMRTHGAKGGTPPPPTTPHQAEPSSPSSGSTDASFHSAKDFDNATATSQQKGCSEHKTS